MLPGDEIGGGNGKVCRAVPPDGNPGRSHFEGADSVASELRDRDVSRLSRSVSVLHSEHLARVDHFSFRSLFLSINAPFRALANFAETTKNTIRKTSFLVQNSEKSEVCSFVVISRAFLFCTFELVVAELLSDWARGRTGAERVASQPPLSGPSASLIGQSRINIQSLVPQSKQRREHNKNDYEASRPISAPHSLATRKTHLAFELFRFLAEILTGRNFRFLRGLRGVDGMGRSAQTGDAASRLAAAQRYLTPT